MNESCEMNLGKSEISSGRAGLGRGVTFREESTCLCQKFSALKSEEISWSRDALSRHIHHVEHRLEK